MQDPGSERQNESFRNKNICVHGRALKAYVLRIDPGASEAFGGLLSAAGGSSGCCISFGRLGDLLRVISASLSLK